MLGVHVCAFTCVYLCVFTCVCIYVCLHVCVFMCVYVCVCVVCVRDFLLGVTRADVYIMCKAQSEGSDHTFLQTNSVSATTWLQISILACRDLCITFRQ